MQADRDDKLAAVRAAQSAGVCVLRCLHPLEDFPTRCDAAHNFRAQSVRGPTRRPSLSAQMLPSARRTMAGGSFDNVAQARHGWRVRAVRGDGRMRSSRE